MTEDDKLYIDWMIGMVFKEKAYPQIVDFWMDAIQEYIRKVLNRAETAPKINARANTQ